MDLSALWADKRAGGALYTHLRRQGKRKRHHGKTRRGHICNRVGIEDRPAIVVDKTRIGDWEIDTVIGKGHRGALVTIVERATQFTLVANVPNKAMRRSPPPRLICSSLTRRLCTRSPQTTVRSLPTTSS